MKTEKLKARIEKMEAELVQMKDELEKIKPSKKMMFPYISGEFYTPCVNYKGDADVDVWHTEEAVFDLNSANLAMTQNEAMRVSKHLFSNIWFTRKALEFADGYKFREGDENISVAYDHNDKCWILVSSYSLEENRVYMTKENADNFIEWLNKHKPNGWD